MLSEKIWSATEHFLTFWYFLLEDSVLSIRHKNKQPPNWQYNTYLTDIESACRGIQLLPGSLPASGYTAKPLSFNISNGLTVYNYTLYEKKENEKAVAKHFNGFERTICEKARAPIWTSAQPNHDPRRSRYTTNKLST